MNSSSRLETIFFSGITAFLLVIVGSACEVDQKYIKGEISNVSVTDTLDLGDVYSKAESIGSVNGVVVQKRGELIAERYFHGVRQGQTVNIKSASKSIISLLIGIALEKGFLESVDQPIHKFFPEYLNERSDPRKLTITIEDLLTMRSGLETTSYENYGPWVTSDNWIRFILKQPVVAEPGGDRMIYSTGNSHLLSVILTRATGMNTRAFAQKYLFDPMNIYLADWDRDPQGYYLGGNNMALTADDMLKIGQMVLNGGKYEGTRIVPEAWLDKSFKTYTQSENNGYDYGYMWWKEEIGGYQTVFAWGWGGQYIFTFPELESVVVLTSFRNMATQERLYKEPVFELVGDYIIPVLLEDGNRLAQSDK
jgi:CubicO group peptidase (beta-lactamase class C family)